MTVTKFVLLGLVVVLAFSGPVVHGNVLDDLTGSINRGVNSVVDGITQTACVISHKSEFDQCYSQVKPAYQNLDYNNVDKNDMKEACCSYLAYRDCVEAVAYKRCGQQAAQSVDALMNSMKGAVGQCNSYNNIFDCMDPVVLVAVLIILAIVAIAILGCLIRICQSCCRC